MSGTELSGSIPTPNPTSTTPSPGAGGSSNNDDDLLNTLNQNQTSSNQQGDDEKDPHMKQLEELMKFVDDINAQVTGAINQAISPAIGAAGSAISQGFNSVQGMFSSGGSGAGSDDAPESDQDNTMGMEGDGVEMSMMSSDTMTDPMDAIENMPELDQFESIVSGPSQGQGQGMDLEQEVTQGVSMVM
ncbi:hypothetical protein DIZ81_13000 [Legionella taurinensis]|uniref:Uncharacterized protein n=1 Tax=Legionella taurinensis TaxID=70611 RepID=A0A3A5LBN3_9GAMM|nr:hypothetical protein [Legionella taurinensis]MDX1835982.1 hypothetical protein [Legionella taurinensis]PUT38694.1 hypothetical protein DB744_13010 [Legionella taurinensis]PUT40073.1 hypothetical protein DB746_12410 [Legionella taurinensis]PUT42225.1 hypothetical protein DB743_12895 [Legionella taurinensis]PUT45997.1 hypothetical protein DB745_11865 [Legionella taurinensis]